jgi:hypothetical protein
MNLVKEAVAPRRPRPLCRASGCALAALVITGITPGAALAQRSPNVDVWFAQGNEFDRGEPGRVMYSGDNGSYVTVLRVNSDGRVTALMPSQPNSRSRYAGGSQGIGLPFQADPTEGVGYVFAIASSTPFDFRQYRGAGNRWNFGTLSQRGGIDPFEIVDRFARSSVGQRGHYSIAYAPYEIGRGGGGRSAYRPGVRYDDAYGGYYGGYEDPWAMSPYRIGYNDYRYYSGYDNTGYRGHGYGNSVYGHRNGSRFDRYDSRYRNDPRTRALRHCPDGTLAPYTTPCRAFAQPRHRATTPRATPNHPSNNSRHTTRRALPRPTPQPRPPHRP